MKNYEEDLVSETCPAKLRAAMVEAIEDAFDPLNCHEAEVLKLSMGLEDSTRRTIQEISSILGLSVSQIEEIEKTALAKAIKKPLLIYYDKRRCAPKDTRNWETLKADQIWKWQ